jgi:hypothetical protein
MPGKPYKTHRSVDVCHPRAAAPARPRLPGTDAHVESKKKTSGSSGIYRGFRARNNKGRTL